MGLGSGSSHKVAPAFTTTYYATCTVDGCESAQAGGTVTVVPPNNSFDQCIEAENSTGDGSITEDPNASNGETRGEENNYNHNVEYAVTSVPAAGTYSVTLRYYSSSIPQIGVQVNGGSVQNHTIANSGSWNIVSADYTFSVVLAAGNNTIKIMGIGGGSCRQDKICVSSGSGGICDAPNAPTLSATSYSIQSGNSTQLSASGCSGGTISWSHGLGTGSPKNVSPITTTTYYAICTVDGCTSTEASVTIEVYTGPFSQCVEAEDASGNGAITEDPNASNGETRGEENNYNHYVDYSITSVPSSGTYNVTLTYFSSSAPTVSVQVNGGTPQTVYLANSGSWNIVSTTQSFNVSLSAGTNTIRIQGTGGGSCRQDKICLSDGSSALLDRSYEDGNNVRALRVSPNPGRGNFIARFWLEPRKEAVLSAVDAQGKIIYHQRVIGKGWHTENIPLNNKAAGTVFMRLLRRDGVETQKILLLR